MSQPDNLLIAHSLPLDYEALNLFENIIDTETPRSSETPTSLYIWNIAENYRYLMLADDLIVILRPDWIDHNKTVISCTQIKTPHHLGLLVEFSKKYAINTFTEVGFKDGLLENCRNELSKLHPEFDSADYVYDTSKIALMQGSEYSDHRHKINKFMRSYSNAEFSVSTTLESENTIREINHLYELWRDFTGRNPKSDARVEQEALQRYLKIHQLTGANAIAKNSRYYYLRVNGQLVGFSIVEIIHDTYAIGHFLKINLNISGISEYFIKNIATDLRQIGILKINTEEDLGIEGLRSFKQRLRPEMLLVAYTFMI